ncbi:MAG: MotA/TolQ/ExbB proton channel family protein, partial [Bryobacteraceae bacterium]
IAEALITTATGLIIAIPALVAYRYLRGRVDSHVIEHPCGEAAFGEPDANG